LTNFRRVLRVFRVELGPRHRPAFTGDGVNLENNFMSENEKLKILAGLVLNNWERLDQTIQIVNRIREQQMDAQFETDGNNLIRHAIDQVSACLESSIATRAEMVKLFNL